MKKVEALISYGVTLQVYCCHYDEVDFTFIHFIWYSLYENVSIRI